MFDLGQSLYEAGRPKIGHMMMQRGFETTDAIAEGVVSTEIVKMRLALDYPVVPDTILEVLSRDSIIITPFATHLYPL